MSPDHPHYLRYREELHYAFFEQKLSRIEIHELLGLMTCEHWNAGIYKSNAAVKSQIHFIINGRVKAFQIHPLSGKAHTLFMGTKGDVFDVMNILDDEQHDLSWETIDSLELLNLPVAQLRLCLQRFPNMNMCFLKYLGKQMRLLEHEVTDIALYNTLTRLSNLLLNHINPNTQQLELIDNLPNDEIASLIGTTRAVVNRQIQVLKKCGAIRVKRKHIYVANRKLLQAFAEEKRGSEQ